MYMSILQLEQLLKDRRDSALNSARSVGNYDRRKVAVVRAKRVRTTIS